ncbi:MAG: cardiolipin synthase [Pseudomonadota bacterium]
MLEYDLLITLGYLYAAIEVLSIAAALNVVMKGRTAQGTIAWAIALVSFPPAALPLYLIFGHHRFHGYVSARRAGKLDINHIAASLAQRAPDIRASFAAHQSEIKLLEKLAAMPFTRYNRADLLIDGEATFGAIFDGIDAARKYILVQFFIVHDDRLGRDFQQRLLARAAAGVKIFFLYDDVGSHQLPAAYLETLRAAGVHTHSFKTTRGWLNRFRINFRNHRKIVVVDGTVAFVGGLNVGDEYMGRSRRFGPWRDTHVRVEGPAVQCIQLAFLEDWYWATHSVPDLNWEPRPAPTGDMPVLVLPTGPADDVETCTLFFLLAINSARHRIWIASPYFVPDRQVISALQLAAMRGVDVRVILPEKPDHILVWLSSFSFVEETEPFGVKFYRYQPGFMHQKVMIVDNGVATIGTANFDNRSFRINFEITLLFGDDAFAAEIRQMLVADMRRCREVTARELIEKPLWFQMAVKIARLMAPVQ